MTEVDLASLFYNRSCNSSTLSRRRTDAFPPEAFTPDLVAREGRG